MGETLYTGPYLVPSLYDELEGEQRIDEIFRRDKCVSNATDNKREFYEWCSNLTIGENFVAKCELHQGNVRCVNTFKVINESYINEIEICPLGGNKNTNITHPLKMEPDVRESVKEQCYYYLVGRPFPWWAIMLIVLAIVIAFSIAAALFWKYWLKKRWRKPAQSTLESRWTESPVSSTSAVDSVARPPPLAPAIPPTSGNTTSQKYNMNSGASMTPGSSRSGSRRISQRSALTRSAGRGSSSGSRGRRARSGH